MVACFCSKIADGELRPLKSDACTAGSVQGQSEGQSNLARLFTNGTAENKAATESRKVNGASPKLLVEAQVILRAASGRLALYKF